MNSFYPMQARYNLSGWCVYLTTRNVLETVPSFLRYAFLDAFISRCGISLEQHSL